MLITKSAVQLSIKPVINKKVSNTNDCTSPNSQCLFYVLQGYGRKITDMNQLKADFEAQALQYLPKLYKLAYVRLGSREDAEDVLQETFLKAFRAYGKKGEGNLLAWLSSILINTIRDYKRKAAITPVGRLDDSKNSDHLMELADPKLNPEQQMIAKDVDASLKNALTTTPEWLLTPFLLREMEQLSYKEIAEVMSIPIGTVMSRLSRARRHLMNKLSGNTDVPDILDIAEKPKRTTERRTKEKGQL
jgi:RNA polymerase sigma-70 factor, ECF subfamily